MRFLNQDHSPSEATHPAAAQSFQPQTAVEEQHRFSQLRNTETVSWKFFIAMKFTLLKSLSLNEQCEHILLYGQTH